jgi:hypothetical protein
VTIVLSRSFERLCDIAPNHHGSSSWARESLGVKKLRKSVATTQLLPHISPMPNIPSKPGSLHCGLIYTALNGPYSTRYGLLQDVSVQANIIGHVAHVTLSQRYENDLSESIEAIYIFPIPARATVCGFNFVRGDGTRTNGIVKEKEAAKAEYHTTVSSGYTAALGEEQTKDGKWDIYLL